MMNIERYELTDVQWNQIKDLFPEYRTNRVRVRCKKKGAEFLSPRNTSAKAVMGIPQKSMPFIPFYTKEKYKRN